MLSLNSFRLTPELPRNKSPESQVPWWEMLCSPSQARSTSGHRLLLPAHGVTSSNTGQKS